MKKFLLSIILLMTITTTFAADIEVVNENTTISLVANEAVKDTMLIAIDGEQMYVFNTCNKLVYKINNTDLGEFCLLLGLGAIIGFIIAGLVFLNL